MACLAPGKYPWPVFSPEGPSVRELAVQALSSVEGGYDLLAPNFDHTPFRTPDGVLDATAEALRPLGPFGRGLDVCCGTGAGLRVLRSLCIPVPGTGHRRRLQRRRPRSSRSTRARGARNRGPRSPVPRAAATCSRRCPSEK